MRACSLSTCHQRQLGLSGSARLGSAASRTSSCFGRGAWTRSVSRVATARLKRRPKRQRASSTNSPNAATPPTAAPTLTASGGVGLSGCDPATPELVATTMRAARKAEAASVVESTPAAVASMAEIAVADGCLRATVMAMTPSRAVLDLSSARPALPAAARASASAPTLVEFGRTMLGGSSAPGGSSEFGGSSDGVSSKSLLWHHALHASGSIPACLTNRRQVDSSKATLHAVAGNAARKVMSKHDSWLEGAHALRRTVAPQG